MQVLNGLDAIVFTAGIGENSSYIRRCALIWSIWNCIDAFKK
jgi:acetate kinase